MFLNQGYSIHEYFHALELKDLFEKTEKQDFLVSVIIQGMLRNSSSVIPESFVVKDLNYVMEKLVQIPNFSIGMNRNNNTSTRQAEKNALNFLTVYAVLNNRHKLAKMLWKRSKDPIPVRI